ncbi:molybdopterin-dependent oxidoreductase [Nocardia sp. NPDC006044]|uniref:molybdopterin-dependent oxidoreductase n=1 Tax=Nocardia sp. NPDC006044 TaxID=3364306 RepID=UPI0036BBD202
MSLHETIERGRTFTARWFQVSDARGPEVASRVGIALGSAILICFVTGLLSHWIQHPPAWFWWPAHPVWLYRLTQGLHVISGVAAIPLLLVKLWAVYPKLFQRPVIGSPLRMLERGSIALLVGAIIFELSTGLLNIAQYYPWKFFFPAAHYAMAFVAIGALAVHLAVKLPIIRDALTRPLDSTSDVAAATTDGDAAADNNTAAAIPNGNETAAAAIDRDAVNIAADKDAAGGAAAEAPADGEVGSAAATGAADDAATDDAVGARAGRGAHRYAGADAGRGRHVSRRRVLTAAWVSAGVAGLAVAGQTVPFLRWVAVLAPRSGEGPQGVPVNRSAKAAGVAELARAADYRLTVAVGDRRRSFSRDELLAMPQVHARLPIACVEGWSASADWSGVRLRDLLAAVGSYPGGDVHFRSLETSGIYAGSVLPQPHVVDSDTLVALAVNGETLDIDHGYPCRLIAPSRPGVLQTKWLSMIEARA